MSCLPIRDDKREALRWDILLHMTTLGDGWLRESVNVIAGNVADGIGLTMQTSMRHRLLPASVVCSVDWRCGFTRDCTDPLSCREQR